MLQVDVGQSAENRRVVALDEAVVAYLQPVGAQGVDHLRIERADGVLFEDDVSVVVEVAAAARGRDFGRDLQHRLGILAAVPMLTNVLRRMTTSPTLPDSNHELASPAISTPAIIDEK